MNCQGYGVYWPNQKEGQLTINGRPVLHYEKTDWPRLDAETLVVSMHSLEDRVFRGVGGEILSD
jgi:hypothetical protein